MSRPCLSAFAVLWAAGLAAPLGAQQLDNPVTLPVLVSGSYTTSGIPPKPPPPEGEGEYDAGWLEFGLSDIGVDEYSIWDNDTFELMPSWYWPSVAELQPNRPYSISIKSAYISELSLWLKPPDGYRLRLIDGPQGYTSGYLSNLDLVNPTSVIFTVVLEREGQRAKGPGVMNQPTMGNLLWSVSLGRLAGGTSAGYVTLAAPEIDGWDVFSPVMLQAVDLGEEVDVIRDQAGDLLQVRFPGGLLVVEVETEDEAIDLLWYADEDVGAKTEGLYTLVGTPSPWRVHEIRKVIDSGVTAFRVSEIEPGTTPVEHTVQVAFDEYEGWVRKSGTKTSLGKVGERTFLDGASDPEFEPRFGGDDVEIERKLNPNESSAETIWREYKTMGDGRELIAEVRGEFDDTYGPVVARPEVTLYQYEESQESSLFRRLRSIRRPDGSWVAYKYFADGPKIGMVRYIAEPWLDSTAQPDPPASFDDTWDKGKLAILDYETGSFDDDSLNFEEMPSRRPRLIEKKVLVEGKIVEHVKHTYEGHYPLGLTSIKITTQRAAGPVSDWDEVPEEIRVIPDMEAPELQHFLYRDMVYLAEYPSGRKDLEFYVQHLTWHGQEESPRWTSGGPSQLRLRLSGLNTGSPVHALGLTATKYQFSSSFSFKALSAVLWTYEMVDAEDIWLVPNQSTAEIIVRSPAGEQLLESYVYTGSGEFQRVGFEATEWEISRPVKRFDHRGEVYRWKYELHQLKEETRPDGSIHVHTYDSQRRRTETLISGAATMTVGQNELFEIEIESGFEEPWKLDDIAGATITYTYDGARRMTNETTNGGGEESLTREWKYDTAGRLIESTAVCSQVTEYDYFSDFSSSIGGETVDWVNRRERTIVGPGLTTIETSWRDGRPRSVTGTGVQPRSWDWEKVVDSGDSTWAYLQRIEVLIADDDSDEHTVHRQQFNGRGQLTHEWTPSAKGTDQFILRELEYDEVLATLSREVISGPDIAPAAVITHQAHPLGLQARQILWSGAGGEDALNTANRVTTIRNTFHLESNIWWFREQVTAMADDSSAAETIVSRTDRRLSFWGELGADYNLTGSTRHYSAHASSWDTATIPTLDATEHTYRFDHGVLATKTWSATATKGALIHGRRGRVEHILDPVGAIEKRGFDELGRPSVVERWLRPTSHLAEIQRTVSEYHAGTTNVETTRRLIGWDGSTPIEDIVTFGYEHCNWLKSITRDLPGESPSEVTTRFGYDSRGRLTRRWGSAVEPEERKYDKFGRLAELHTFRGEPDGGWDATWPESGVTADVVKWVRHDPTGLVTAEEDAAEKSTSFEYDGLNRQVTRTTAEGRKRITEYVPHLGDVDAIRYEVPTVVSPAVPLPETADIEFAYDRMGRITGVTDALGTRTFAFDPTGDRRLLHEQLPAGYGESDYGPRRITHRYDGQRRWNGYQLGDATDPYLDADVTYTWSSVNGRLTGVTGELDPGFSGSGTTRTWTYAYAHGGHQPTQVYTGSGSTRFRINTVRSPERPGLVTEVANEFGSTAVALYGYEWDRRGRLETAHQAGDMFENLYGTQGLKLSYGYDDRDRLTSAETKWHNGSSWGTVADREFTAAYDHAGNRVETTRYTTGTGGTQEHTPNELNQITEFENVPRALITGSAPTSMNVDVRKGAGWAAAARAHKYFYYGFQDVRTSDNYANIEVEVYEGTEEGDYFEVEVPVRRHEETRAFDDDGNPESSGSLTYRYDGENRLIEVKRGSDTRLRHTYDWQGRRARTQIIFGSDPEDPEEVRTFDFVYLGGRLISQVITNVGEWSEYDHEDTQELYLWGLDRSGTLEGAGTIGGLLSMVRGWDSWEEHSLIAQDGLGNVVAYINPANGQRRAEFEYGPFGDTVRTTATGYGDGASWAIHRFAHRWQNKFSSAFFANLDLAMPEYYDFGLRHYEPSLGRFLNRDPIGTAGGSNVYAFVRNNPFGGWDAWGLVSSDSGGLFGFSYQANYSSSLSADSSSHSWSYSLGLSIGNFQFSANFGYSESTDYSTLSIPSVQIINDQRVVSGTATGTSTSAWVQFGVGLLNRLSGAQSSASGGQLSNGTSTGPSVFIDLGSLRSLLNIIIQLADDRADFEESWGAAEQWSPDDFREFDGEGGDERNGAVDVEKRSIWWNPFTWTESDWRNAEAGRLQGYYAWVDGLTPFANFYADMGKYDPQEMRASRHLGMLSQVAATTGGVGAIGRGLVGYSRYAGMSGFERFYLGLGLPNHLGRAFAAPSYGLIPRSIANIPGATLSAAPSASTFNFGWSLYRWMRGKPDE